jgi:outer membrane protein assembly factor BamE (lipoprotein component of BamABCDE complex)
MRYTWSIASLCLLMVTTGCGGKIDIKEDRLTVGKVQGEIKIGMPGSHVAELLGSPNIVTTDENRHEVWIYDKVSSSRVDSARSSFATLFVLGTNSHKSSSSQSQRTLTIIIKYDDEKTVRDFAYNYTQF